jgi:hypothetical protein
MDLNALYVKVRLFTIKLLRTVRHALQLNHIIHKAMYVNVQTTTFGMTLLAFLAIFPNTLIMLENNAYHVLVDKSMIWK